MPKKEYLDWLEKSNVYIVDCSVFHYSYIFFSISYFVHWSWLKNMCCKKTFHFYNWAIRPFWIIFQWKTGARCSLISVGIDRNKCPVALLTILLLQESEILSFIELKISLAVMLVLFLHYQCIIRQKMYW